jgi:hypothetical protein
VATLDGLFLVQTALMAGTMVGFVLARSAGIFGFKQQQDQRS